MRRALCAAALVALAGLSLLLGRDEARGRIVLRPQDRVAFVRFPKTGTTMLHHSLFYHTGLCVNQCLRPEGQCTECLYDTACGCNGTRLLHPATAAQTGCYGCGHRSPAKLQRWHAAMGLGNESRLYAFAVVRDPADRVLSEYFYSRGGCVVDGVRRDLRLAGWLKERGPAATAAACAPVVTAASVLAYASANGTRHLKTRNCMAAQLLGLFRTELSAAQGAAAVAMLQSLDVIIPSERLYPLGIAVMGHVFGAAARHPDAGLGFAERVRVLGSERGRLKPNLVRRTEVGLEERRVLAANRTLRAELRRLNPYDVALHEAARRHFETTLANF